MFINKTDDGKNNICGSAISAKRIELQLSQRELAERLQLNGLDIDKNAVQRIECGKRFVTDIELKVISNALSLTYNELLSDS